MERFKRTIAHRRMLGTKYQDVPDRLDLIEALLEPTGRGSGTRISDRWCRLLEKVLSTDVDEETLAEQLADLVGREVGGQGMVILTVSCGHPADDGAAGARCAFLRSASGGLRTSGARQPGGDPFTGRVVEPGRTLSGV